MLHESIAMDFSTLPAAKADAMPARLMALASLLAADDPPSLCGSRLAEAIAQIVVADFCCVVLKDGADQDRLRVSAHGNAGPLSISARRALVRSGSTIRRLLAGAAVEPREALDARLALHVAIVVEQRVIGVIHARRNGKLAPAFSDEQVAGARLAAVLIASSTQLGVMKGLLRSNFAQYALARGPERSEEAIAGLADPRDVVLRIARSFYRELKNANVEDRLIVAASAEIIAQLTLDLKTRTPKLTRP